MKSGTQPNLPVYFRVILAVFFVAAAFACLNLARHGEMQVGGVSVGRFGEESKTPEHTTTLSNGGRVFYGALTIVFFGAFGWTAIGLKKKP